jgi:hypothetical protein
MKKFIPPPPQIRILAHTCIYAIKKQNKAKNVNQVNINITSTKPVQNYWEDKPAMYTHAHRRMTSIHRPITNSVAGLPEKKNIKRRKINKY